MAELTVYEKRTCTKCRQLIVLLRERGVDFDAVDFHVEPLGEDELRALVRKAGVPARDLLRTREPVYQELGLADRELGDDEVVVALMAEHPQLLERPVVVRGERAVLARPTERVLELLD